MAILSTHLYNLRFCSLLKKIILLISLSFSSLFSQQEIYIPNPGNFYPIENQPINNDIIPKEKNINSNTFNINDDELLKDKELTASILDKAIEMQASDIIEHLIPLYSTFENKDVILFIYAQARLNHLKGYFKDAIDKYKQILSLNDSLSPIRLYLIVALLENNQFDLASKELDLLAKDNDLPENIKQIVYNYKTIIEEELSFKYTFQIDYISDKNINETSNDEYIKLGENTFKRDEKSLPQSGKGIHYNYGIEKPFKIKDQNFLVASIQNNGKYYYNQKDYNDNIIRANLGYRFQDAIKTINIMPFYQTRFFANDKYNYTYGNLINTSINLNREFKIIPSIEYGRNFHEERTFLDGYYFYESLGTNYILNNQTMLFNEFSVYNNRTKDSSESFIRKNLKIGFYRDLPLDLRSQVSFSMGNKLYDNDNNMFNIRRDDNEYTEFFSIWDKEFRIFKMTPKFNIELNKSTSNINIYNYDNNKYFFSLEKLF